MAADAARPTTMHAAPDLLLVDGSYYLFRAYHALPPLKNREGLPTGALYGVINMLRSLQEAYRPPRMVVVFDPPGGTFRNTLAPDYKGNRPPTPEDLVAQVPPLHALIRAMGLPLLCVEGEEADDVIATLARRAVRADMHVLVATGDKDLAQLVDAHTCLIDTMKNTVLDVPAVERKFGVPPAGISDYLALTGDAVDNIPGVPSVGPKTALKWLREFGSLEAVIAAAGRIQGKVGEQLRAHLQQLSLSKQLVTLRDALDLPVGLEDLEIKAPDVAALREQFQRWGFTRWLRTLHAQAELLMPEPVRSEAVAVEVHILRDEAALSDWITQLRAAEACTLWVETAGPQDMYTALVGMGFAVGQRSAYLPLGHAALGDAPGQVRLQTALDLLKGVLEDSAVAKFGHGLKHAVNVCARHGIALNGIAGDTMLASYVYDSTVPHHEDLPALCRHYLDEQAPVYESVVGKGVQRIAFTQVGIAAAAAYVSGRVMLTQKLHQRLTSLLEDLKAQRAIYRDLELPLVAVLACMERNGVLIDPVRLAEQGRELGVRLRDLEAQVYKLVGKEFNLSSPQQLRHVLFDPEGLHLPVGRRTPKGEPSTAEEVLHKLAEEHELPRLILQHRTLDKLRNTYVEKLPACIRSDSGRVHTVYHQAVAVTGRLSSVGPNLQNIPVRTPEGRRIRRAFIAPPGHLLLTADYSQIELRIMAHLSKDTRLCAAFAADEDVHVQTAAEVFDVAPEGVSDEQRRAAKAINFGLIYGMSAYGLARQLGIDTERADLYMQRYFERYCGVREYMDRVRADASKQGWVQTFDGRRLHLPELHAANGARRRAAERAAINAPMQGTAADIIKRAMLSVHQWLMGEDCGARMVMQVHDELVFEVAEDRIAAVGARVCTLMESAGTLDVPLVVTVGSGADWEAAH